MASLVAACVVAVVLYTLTRAMCFMPKFALSAIVFVAIVKLVDVPGFEEGDHAEETAVLRFGANLMAALAAMRVPRYTQ